MINIDYWFRVLLPLLNIALFWVIYKFLFKRWNKKSQSPLPQPSFASSKCCSQRKSSESVQSLHGNCPCSQKNSHLTTSIKVFYSSQTGTAHQLATDLVDFLKSSFPNISHEINVLNINDYDVDDLFNENSVCLFLMSTYTGGTANDDASWFFQWLEDTYFDFRVSRDSFHKLKFAILGLGHSDYGENYCKVARIIHHRLEKLSALSLLPLHYCDAKFDQLEQYSKWKESLCMLLENALRNNISWSDARIKSEVNYESDEGESVYLPNEKSKTEVDLEDLGGAAFMLKESKTSSNSEVERKAPVKEMVTPLLKNALSKQGYRIIGSHSGVKICRWTKAMLRGRGGCYKHTFYGIASHQCMETTPSLACANKCVFCWRHHTNPVGTEWRWKMDDASFVLEGALENHLKMIKQLKGVPGVDSERFREAQKVRHCALSLVGEPIMYPEINEFVRLLHKRSISSFLVTNAQFPELITALKPVTQLYVSIDASTKDSLKAIDRPLFKDFWERFIDSLKALSYKKQRTVYRLTLVKKFNDEEIDNYVQLINIGRPDFIEVKGVTFCGYSGANPLTMLNVPFHSEVVSFCKELCSKLASLHHSNQHTDISTADSDQLDSLDYDISCEHEHSCSVLIANKKFFINNQWHTWIDYDKFHILVNSNQPFSSLDYISKTPDWALTGATEKGFDPKETRFYRNSNKQSVNNNEQIDHGC